MSAKRVGWCRIENELVFDKDILNHPYIRDDMDVYLKHDGRWLRWAPESQGYDFVMDVDIPDVVKMAMVMLE